jgi:hypothetical protein
VSFHNKIIRANTAHVTHARREGTTQKKTGPG